MSGGQQSKGVRLGLVVAAVGIVFGDIGTSPLYAFREALAPGHGVPLNQPNVTGVLSLIIWALIVIIAIKYITLVMRADNHGEGGILALASLLFARPGEGRRWWLFLAGLFGTALLYGEGAITPAISVLSAVEGLEIATPVFEPYVVPIAIVILVALFSVQSRGTAALGRVFGAIMLVWFVVLAVLGLGQILGTPAVLAAFNPRHAFSYLATNGFAGFASLGSVVLVVTGAEALYADIGHFGVGPIRISWFTVVMPALILTYLGQGALLISTPGAIENPFYLMAPAWALIPLVVLATSATVVASQALITGAFSLTVQAIQLDCFPRLQIRHTSTEEKGQVYLPAVNWILMVVCIGLVVTFRTSSNLAAAYGLAVTGTMVITTVLFAAVATDRFGWARWKTALVVIPLLVVDLAFFGANVLKIPAGGWFPLAAAALVYFIMRTWRMGRRLVNALMRRADVRYEQVFATWDSKPVTRVPGTAVYMFSEPWVLPPALLSNLAANHTLHEEVVLLSVISDEVPHVPAARRLEVTELDHGFTQIIMHFGFSEQPDVAAALAASDDPVFHVADTVFVLGRETIRSTPRRYTLTRAQERIFVFLHRNASDAARYFRLPSDRVVEIGRIVEI
ncbi:MAG TPA: potassium transporter Kup [Acidimicrobiia bacterium]|nr:potassium transporter Kup [Acidimicrobiia bacterium]